MRVVFACEDAALLDQCVIEAREGITQLEEMLAYLRTHAGQEGGCGAGGASQTEQDLVRAQAMCRQADKVIGKISTLFVEEMAGLRARQQVLLSTWRAERQEAPNSRGELVQS